MRLARIWQSLVVGLLAGAAAADEAPRDLVVHEWGTFLAMAGSDGVALDGMYHEEHALPGFVHARSRDQLRLPSVSLKGETPVIYFYTPRRQQVRVGVRFPRGLWTQWYPQAGIVGPQFAQAASPVGLRDGRIVWYADVIPAGPGMPVPTPAPPPTSADALWRFARDVDAAYVQTSDSTKDPARVETERFLFYRGLGAATLPLRMTAAAGGTLALDAAGKHGARHVFVLRVEGGKGAYAYRPALTPGQEVTGVIPSMAGARPVDEFAATLADDLARRLVEGGLYPKEARAMVNTWKASYFRTEGVRALFVAPQAWTDEFIPMTVSPAPRAIVRVMVGRLELLTPERERLAEAAVRDLGAPDAATRRRAFDALRAQGRYVEPIVRRVLGTSPDARVRDLCRRLLLTDFVTDLRSAVQAPGDARQLADDPVHARAQLGALLREVGLPAEAEAEGRAVLAALAGRPAPPMDRDDARHYLRASARAAEAVGDDRDAADRYGRFIRFGSQVGHVADCRGCHHDAGPKDMAWFRDWWAGKAFARAVERSGGLEAAIVGRAAELARSPDDDATRMMLAYLYERQGKPARARAMWAALLGSPKGPGAAPAVAVAPPK